MSDNGTVGDQQYGCEGCDDSHAVPKHDWENRSLCPKCYGEERGYYAQ